MVDNVCEGCLKTYTVRRNCMGRYCSNACQQEKQLQVMVADWLAGGKISARTLRRYLLSVVPRCAMCGISDWNEKPLTLELEHKDGNSENNRPDNVCLICPNCHSQTPTYKAKNKGNGRHFRRMRNAAGKSF